MFDFENPNVMLDSNNNPVSLDSNVYSINDRIGTIPSIAQNDINLQATRKEEHIEFSGSYYSLRYNLAFDTPGNDTDVRRPTTFFVAKPKVIVSNPTTFAVSQLSCSGLC